MFNRTDRSMISVWWWTIDRWLLGSVVMLMIAGVFMVAAASPSVAMKIGVADWFFVKRHLIYLALSIPIMLVASLCNDGMIRVMGILGLLVMLGLIGATLLLGAEVKGARRWVSIAGFQLQPSEFAKPCFAITCAWLLSSWRENRIIWGKALSFLLLGLMVFLLVLQPDIGMTFLFLMTWGALFFLAGMPIGQAAGLGVAGIATPFVAYQFLPHFATRVDKFLTGTNYQASVAMESFAQGGLFGVGAAEGKLKKHLPDAHADFIYAVVAEEYGALICLVLLGCYAVIVWRGFGHAGRDYNLFRVLAIAGLVLQFGLQAAIHMASSLQLIPTKGITLPFISYGGSSLVTSALTMGLLMGMIRQQNILKPAIPINTGIPNTAPLDTENGATGGQYG